MKSLHQCDEKNVEKVGHCVGDDNDAAGKASLLKRLREIGHQNVKFRRHDEHTRDSNAVALAEIRQHLLAEIRMNFNLIDGWRDGRSLHQIHQKGARMVRHANRLGQAGSGNTLHARPRVAHGRLGEFELARRWIRPTSGVARGRSDIFQRDREVNEVQIEVIEVEVGERLLATLDDALSLVVSAPQLARNENFGTAQSGRLKAAANALANLDLVAIIGRAVEVAVAVRQSEFNRAPNNAGLGFLRAQE